ncbi:hypothetical protein GEMRC1_007337 [Eukaryota sp. GEM-RC1]
MSSSIVLGIDLGTTNSCAAVYRQKRNPNGSITSHNIQVLYDFNSSIDLLVPSVVCFTSSTKCVVGIPALASMKKYPENTVFEVKRFIGSRFDDEHVQQMKKTYPFNIVELIYPAGCTGIKVNDQTYRPEEISAKVLSYIRTNAVSVRGWKTSPKLDHQRQATKSAAELAGFDEITLVSEPIAAVLSLKQEDPTTLGKRVLVFDFGGGTFDVSIVDINSDDVTVIGTDGSTNLGGANINLAIVEDVMNYWAAKNNSMPNTKKKVALRFAVEEAKKLMATCETADIDVDNFASGEDLEFVLTKQRFDAICDLFVTKCLSIVERLLQFLHLQSSDIDHVQLVGGSCRIASVEGKLKIMFPGKVKKTLNPDQCVAAGASVYFEHVIHDVTPHSLGTDIKSKSETKEVDTMAVIIPRHSRIPCKLTQTFVTTADSQTTASIAVYQGESTIVSQNTFLARFKISNLPPLPAEEAKVSTTMSIDSNGILHVDVEDLQDKSNTASIKIEKLQSEFRFSHQLQSVSQRH